MPDFELTLEPVATSPAEPLESSSAPVAPEPAVPTASPVPSLTSIVWEARIVDPSRPPPAAQHPWVQVEASSEAEAIEAYRGRLGIGGTIHKIEARECP